MNLPFGDQAIVESRKLTEYLLNPTHPQGQSKAVFFQALGFDSSRPEALRQALLELGRTSDMTEEVSSFGNKYVGAGVIHSPTGKEARVITVWIMRGGVPPPILVTAYPAP